MSFLQNKFIRGIDGNWQHILEKHPITPEEVISVFRSGSLAVKRNKRRGSADYMVIERAFTGKIWIWVHTAF